MATAPNSTPRSAADSGADSSAHTNAHTSTDSGAAPPPQVWPSLRARNARALIRFLVDAFGFTEVVAYGEGEFVAHAELAWPEGGGVMLGSDREDPAGAEPWPGRPGGFTAYVVTAGPDAVHARAVAAGARITSDLQVTDYGSRDFAAADPEGNRWYFGTYRGAPRPAAG
ncbi:VOC family protein [Kitasatospora sp. NPDC048239]|uniref:VOC family protein n=1 Tax=Kitasatospora sp. NPDC048239 TaxID=3364046 RepID=UPI00371249F8